MFSAQTMQVGITQTEKVGEHVHELELLDDSAVSSKCRDIHCECEEWQKLKCWERITVVTV